MDQDERIILDGLATERDRRHLLNDQRRLDLAETAVLMRSPGILETNHKMLQILAYLRNKFAHLIPKDCQCDGKMSDGYMLGQDGRIIPRSR